MTRKSPQQPDSVPGQRPPLDADDDTVAIPRPADELSGIDENDVSKDEDRKKAKR